MNYINEAMKSVPKQHQSQAALNDQLRALIAVSNKLGLYDAADYLNQIVNKG
jgi:hypothetical protein